MSESDICDNFFEDTTYETSDNISSISSNSGATSTIFSDQSNVAKKIKLNHPKPRRQYTKSSWVWKHFTLSKDKVYCICTVEITKLSNKKVKCGHKLLYDDGTGNMSSHLQIKHNLHEKRNKNQDRTTQQTLLETIE
ncbi:14839_t:CDS:2, partial [Racocetra persica]